MKNLAKRHFVSPTTVNRVQGKMSFIHMDAQTHEILDILPNRQLHALRSYFSQFPLAVRKQLQSVVIDMNTPYFIMI